MICDGPIRCCQKVLCPCHRPSKNHNEVDVREKSFTMEDREAISVILADNSEHWKPRLAALEELHALAESARATPEKLSREIFAVLRVPMKKQLTDLRSQIVRAACTVTTHLAKVAGHRSREFLSYVMPTLISISAGANKVMAGFALDCTRDVVAAVQVQYSHLSVSCARQARTKWWWRAPLGVSRSR